MRKCWHILVTLALLASSVSPVSAARGDVDADVRPVVREGRGLCAAYGGGGGLLVTDAWHNVIWLRTAENTYTVFAGAASGVDAAGRDVGGYKDGKLAEARFNRPWSIIRYQDGYAVADTGNNAVRLIRDGQVSTLVSGNAAERPAGLAADENDNLYVSLTGKNCVLKIDAHLRTTTITGGFLEPTGLCFQGGLLYVCDSGNNRVVTVDAAGRVAIVAEGLDIPQGVLARGGSVYIAETGGGGVFVWNGRERAALSPNRETRSPREMALLGDTLYFADEYGVRSAWAAAGAFDDVDGGAWYAPAVAWAVQRGYMVGCGDGSFAPEAAMTRAMLTAVLARIAGADASGGEPWYAASLKWAADGGVSDGTRPMDNATRREFAAMLYRSARLGANPDADGAAAWAKALGAMGAGAEDAPVTRAQAADIFFKWVGGA